MWLGQANRKKPHSSDLGHIHGPAIGSVLDVNQFPGEGIGTRTQGQAGVVAVVIGMIAAVMGYVIDSKRQRQGSG